MGEVVPAQTSGSQAVLKTAVQGHVAPCKIMFTLYAELPQVLKVALLYDE